METFSALLAICAGNSPVPVNSTHKGQWRGALMFSLICARINNWVNNRKAGDLMRRHLGHYDVNVMGRPHTWMVAPTAPPHYTHCILRMYTDKCGTKWNDKNIAIHNCVAMITNWNNKWENWQTLAHCFQFSLMNTALLKIDIIKSTLNKCNLYW